MGNLITLTTDFGNADYFVGAMKGVIFSICPTAQTIDLTHEIEPQNILSGAFTLFNAAKEFPAETIHVCVVDPGVGSNRRAILVVTEKHFFIAPDNGVLSFVWENDSDFRVFELTNDKFFRQPLSNTFHGRDIFAPVAAHLANGIKPEEFGAEIGDFVRLEMTKPRKIDEGSIETEILHIDRFGNLLINLRREDLPKEFLNKGFAVKIKETEIARLCNFFAEAEKGEIFMIFGSADFLEVVANCNSAQKILQTEIGEKVEIKRL